MTSKAFTCFDRRGAMVETKAKSESFIKEKFDTNLNFTKVTWPNVREGSIIEITYRITSDFLFNFQDWEFQTSIPTRWSEYRARIPEYFNYEKYMQGYVSLNVVENEMASSSFTVNSSHRNGGGAFNAPTSTSFTQDKVEYQEARFRWAAKDIPAFKKEPFMAALRKLVLYSVNGVSTATQGAALEALAIPESVIESRREEYRTRRDVLVHGLNELGLECEPPAGAFYAFPRVTKIHKDSRRVATTLLDKAHVATVPGVVFGAQGEGHVRFGYAVPINAIEAGLEALRKFIK